jgi:hypothetical protein
MNFLRQLFEITTRKLPTAEKLARSNQESVVIITAMIMKKEEKRQTISSTTLSDIMMSKGFLKCQ